MLYSACVCVCVCVCVCGVEGEGEQRPWPCFAKCMEYRPRNVLWAFRPWLTLYDCVGEVDQLQAPLRLSRGRVVPKEATFEW